MTKNNFFFAQFLVTRDVVTRQFGLGLYLIPVGFKNKKWSGKRTNTLHIKFCVTPCDVDI